MPNPHAAPSTFALAAPSASPSNGLCPDMLAPHRPTESSDRAWFGGGTLWLALLLVAAPLLAGDGAPAPGFGVGGRTLIPFFAGTAPNDDQGLAVAFQPDGKLVVGGAAGYDTAASAIPESLLALTRLNRDGSLDTTFATGGRFTHAFEHVTGSRFDQATAVVVQPDGRILACGAASTNTGWLSALAVLRLTRTGVLDTTFGGGDGELTIDSGYAIAGCAVALRRDGRIVLAPLGWGSEAVLVQLTTAGALDTTFGAGGISEGWSCGETTCAYRGVVETPEGLVAMGADGTEVVFARYLTEGREAGSLDPTFGTDGLVHTVNPTPGSGQTFGVALQLDTLNRPLALLRRARTTTSFSYGSRAISSMRASAAATAGRRCRLPCAPTRSPCSRTAGR